MPTHTQVRSKYAELVSLYGPTMNMVELAGVLKIRPKHLANKLSEGVAPVPTFKPKGCKRRLANTADVAELLEG